MSYQVQPMDRSELISADVPLFSLPFTEKSNSKAIRQGVPCATVSLSPNLNGLLDSVWVSIHCKMNM